MKTNPYILLGRILQKMIDQGHSQMEGYNKFTYISHNHKQLVIGREDGEDTPISFDKLLLAIEKYQENLEDYERNTTAIRDYGITHKNSPIYSLLHLLEKEDYQS